MRLLSKFLLAVPLLFLVTCSFKTFRPEVGVNVSLAPERGIPYRSNPLIEGVSCFLVVFQGNGQDDFSDQVTSPRSHTCLHVFGKSSQTVSLASMRAGVGLSVPQGSYDIEIIGFYDPLASGCAGESVRAIFSTGTPQIYSVAKKTSTVVSPGTAISLTSTYDNDTGVDLGVSCSNPLSGWAFTDGGGSFGVNYNTSEQASQPQFTVFNSKLYLGWIENTTPYSVRAAVYNGNDSSPSYAFVDGGGANGLNYNTGRSAFNVQLTSFNSKLYSTWQEN